MGLFKQGDPLTNANARKGIEELNSVPRATLRNVVTHAAPVASRLHQNEKEGYHYHYFGDDTMRIEHGKALGYVFADVFGEPCDYDKAFKVGGVVRMRILEAEYRQRKERLYRVEVPKRERAARENFLAVGESLNPDTQPEDLTRSHRGPFSAMAARQQDGSFKEED